VFHKFVSVLIGVALHLLGYEAKQQSINARRAKIEKVQDKRKRKKKERRKKERISLYDSVACRTSAIFSRSSGERGTKQAWSVRQFRAGLFSPDKSKKGLFCRLVIL